MTAASQYYSVTARVGVPHRHEVEVTVPLVGPAGATGPAGAAGASAWNDITGKPATFPPSAHDHQPDEVYADAAFVSQTGGSGRGGIYLRNGSDNGKPLYESPATGDYIWWDSNIDTWYLTSRPGVNLFEITNNTDNFPWETDALWQPIAPQTGNVEVDQASLFDVSDYSSTSVIGLKTPKSGNASSDELVLGSDTRLTNSRTPTAHASTHHTGGSDPLTPANIGAAPAVNVIELTADGSTTITTSQLPARGIAFSDGEATFTVNLPTPDIRQSGLTFSIKSEYESGSGPNFITVVHAAVNLLTTYELDEAESSIDFLWDGYAWTYSSTSRLRSYPNRVLQLPAASGTIARTEDFASPPAIGNTTPNSGAFTTLTANNGTVTANTPALNVSQTWNSSGVGFRAFTLDVTTISAANTAMLAEFLHNGTSRFRFTPAGTLDVTTDGGFNSGAAGINIGNGGSFRMNNQIELHTATGGILEQRRAANAQTFRLYTTYGPTASDYERLFIKGNTGGAFQIGTEKGSTGGSARALEFQTNGVTRLTIATNGAANFGSNVTLNSGSLSVSNGGLTTSGSGTSFLQGWRWQITSSSIPATISSNLNALELYNLSSLGSGQSFRVYNTRTTATNFERLNLRWASNELILDAEAGVDGGTLRGIKIGSATSSLLGFYGVTPVDQPATVTDPTGVTTDEDVEARTAINAIIDRLQELGLIA